LLNAPVRLQSVITRLRPDPRRRSSQAIRFHRRTVRAAQEIRVRAESLAATAQLAPGTPATPPVRRTWGIRGRRPFGAEAVLPVAVASIVLGASFVSWLPGTTSGPTGGPTGDGPGPRIAIGGVGYGTEGNGPGDDQFGATSGDDAPADPSAGGIPTFDLTAIDPDALAMQSQPDGEPAIRGPFLADGTLLKPIAVDTRVPDGKGLLRTYTVRSGDTLTGIANRFGLSMMTIWWANNLKTKDLTIGQALRVPPVDGLVVTVREGDTLESIAAAHDVDAGTIYEMNGLEDRILVAGQTLVLPGATGDRIATPKPKPTAKPVVRSGGGSVRPPTTYHGGGFAWPVVGGNNYVSQYFHYGHYAIDIAADYGSTVRAAAGGTVIFAGWKNNGGGYQVYVAHGSGLYTTYNHMSAITVGRGQVVGRGQQVGRVGQSGVATGPHLHFEVWRGPVWDGGSRINPMLYL